MIVIGELDRVAGALAALYLPRPCVTARSLRQQPVVRRRRSPDRRVRREQRRSQTFAPRAEERRPCPYFKTIVAPITNKLAMLDLICSLYVLTEWR